MPGQVDTSTTATANPPLFTCFGSANEGLPLNPSGMLSIIKHAGFLWIYRQSFWLRLSRPGHGDLPQSGFGSGPTRTDVIPQAPQC